MESLAKKYPKYYKAVPAGVPSDEVDTYVINMMFPVDDASGTILHARKKLLIPGVRSGGKSLLKDVIEARDTLNRYIALHEVVEVEVLDKVPEPTEVAESTPVDGLYLGDGWFSHAAETRPEVLEPGDFVEVRLKNGMEYTGNFSKRAVDWVWATDPVFDRIVAWRMMKVEQEKPELDGWKELEDRCMPAGLDPDEVVEVMVDNDVMILMAKRADQWDWKYRSAGTPAAAPHITHWRRYRHGA